MDPYPQHHVHMLPQLPLDAQHAQQPKPTVSRNARACTVCRAVKMKCVGAEDGLQPCQRCKRGNLQCVFEKHRRGRKPGSKLSDASKLLRRIDTAHDTLDVASPVQEGQQQHVLSYAQQAYRVEQQSYYPIPAPIDPRLSASSSSSSSGPLPGIQHLASPASHYPPSYHTSARLSPSRHIRSPDREPRPDDRMYDAPSHLHRESHRNTFFGTILNPPSEQQRGVPQPQLLSPVDQRPPSPSPPLAHDATQPAATAQPQLPPPYPVPPFADPVSAGILTESEASNLFELIFLRLNPFLMMFDPNLHSMQYIRSRSPFLFTCMLTAACKLWRPEAHKGCLDLTRAFIPLAFERQWRSVEVVQAFLFLSFYPESDDDRAWTYVGYASRMAIQLGMHRVGGGFDTEPDAPISAAERRARERTYLVLFIQDRTLAMLCGKQTMLPDSELTRTAGTWYTDPTIPGGPSVDDVMVCAIVELRRIVMETYDLVKSRAMTDSDLDSDVALNSCNNKLSDWMELWHTALQRGGGQMFHFSVLCLYRLHTRLYLNGLGLQMALTARVRRAPGLQTISRCYTSGLSALVISTKELAPARQLKYTTHLITLMTTYCAVFLLQLVPISAVYTDFADMREKIIEMVAQTAAAYDDEDGGNVDVACLFRGLLESELAPRSPSSTSSCSDNESTAVEPSSAGGSADRRSPACSRTPSPVPVLRPAPPPVRGFKQNPAYEFPARPAIPPFPLRDSDRRSGDFDRPEESVDNRSRNAEPGDMAERYWRKVFTQLGFGRVPEVPEVA
ncbi:hypothetical protein EXIGLDRAFT_769749 [Exidia glandulosa HHB12029]|uniref:Zn(2)-C6 fungal-type domain-containing protein n=1 Tax=Exidia glandulosa HHB12029 TaxID=1314781 RepID=A0A165H8H3_EXIGL|nr:hypothetical protein EXIGLDRAFT_769749 [Exidia glandulosa HHB12029]